MLWAWTLTSNLLNIGVENALEKGPLLQFRIARIDLRWIHQTTHQNNLLFSMGISCPKVLKTTSGYLRYDSPRDSSVFPGTGTFCWPAVAPIVPHLIRTGLNPELSECSLPLFCFCLRYLKMMQYKINWTLDSTMIQQADMIWAFGSWSPVNMGPQMRRIHAKLADLFNLCYKQGPQVYRLVFNPIEL